jgi:hypothetical protein
VQNVHITCQREAVLLLVEELERWLALQEEAVIVEYGYTQKQVHGYIVLEWLDEADEAFLKQLEQESRVIDFCVYTVFPLDDSPFGVELTVPEPEREYPPQEVNRAEKGGNSWLSLS